MSKITRRNFMQGVGAGAVLMSSSLPGVSLASINSNKRYICFVLRGGMDGLAAIPTHGDELYQQYRRELALPMPNTAVDSIIDLDGYFGLHPAMHLLKAFWERDEMALMHFSAYHRDRSHFDAQNVLENGTNTPNGAYDGWLNRALDIIQQNSSSYTGVAISQSLPLILRGDAPVTSWIPTGRGIESDSVVFDHVIGLYEEGSVLRESLENGHQMRMDVTDVEASLGAPLGRDASSISKLLGELMAEPDGPNIATIELSGWDTHSNQGTTNGDLAMNLAGLAEGIQAMYDELKPFWNDTVITVVSEFGRTVKPNGTQGTDHGTGGVVMAFGGGINGGQHVGQMSSLNTLYDNRDLDDANDARSMFKSVFRDHFGMNTSDIESSVMPGSADVPYIDNLFGSI